MVSAKKERQATDVVSEVADRLNNGQQLPSCFIVVALWSAKTPAVVGYSPFGTLRRLLGEYSTEPHIICICIQDKRPPWVWCSQYRCIAQSYLKASECFLLFRTPLETLSILS